MTFEEVLAHLNEQLDWRGPSGKPMGIVTLSREQAELLCAELNREQRDEVHGTWLAMLVDD